MNTPYKLENRVPQNFVSSLGYSKYLEVPHNFLQSHGLHVPIASQHLDGHCEYIPQNIVCSLEYSEYPEVPHNFLQPHGLHVSIATKYLEGHSYWVPQKLPQIYTVIESICIRKVA